MHRDRLYKGPEWSICWGGPTKEDSVARCGGTCLKSQHSGGRGGHLFKFKATKRPSLGKKEKERKGEKKKRGKREILMNRGGVEGGCGCRVKP